MAAEDAAEEGLASRHAREVTELGERCRVHLESARAVGSNGKKAKSALEAAEREVEQWRYELATKHSAEVEEEAAKESAAPASDPKTNGTAVAAGAPTLKKGAKKKTPAASKASNLAGRWLCDDGAPVEIAGTTLRFVDTGGIGQLTQGADGGVHLAFKGQTHKATLDQSDGSLRWSDGDVWRRSEATPDVAKPTVEPLANGHKSPEPVASSTPAPRPKPAKASGLAGRWRADDGALVEVTGTKLKFVDTGGTGKLTQDAAVGATLVLKGKSYHATLEGDGSLLWSDGDVWRRAEDLDNSSEQAVDTPAEPAEEAADEGAAAPGRKKKNGKTAKSEAEASGLEGRWLCDDGAPVEVEGTALRFVDTGGTGQLTRSTDGCVHLLFKGKSYNAKLGANGSLLWSDGDVWHRKEDSTAVPPAPQPVAQRKKKTTGTKNTAAPQPLQTPDADSERPCATSNLSWYEDALAVEDVAPPDPACVSEAEACEDDPEIIPDIKPHTVEVRSNAAMQSLLSQSKELSEDCFYEDCTEGCSKRGGWRLTLLASGMEKGSGATLLGFLVFRLKPDLQMPVLSVSKLAVPESFRRRGYGRKLINWSTQYAKTLPMIQCIGLSSLPDAVTFYQRLGFRRMHVIKAKEDVSEQDDDLIPGQVYMEYRIKRAGVGRRR